MSKTVNDSSGSIAEQRLTLSNGLELAYYDSCAESQAELESADKATVVLLHGYCGSSAYWERLIPILKHHCRIIAPDARGHGRSAETQDVTYTMELYAEDIAEMLVHLKINKPIILGHSLGGYVTLAFVERHAKRLAGFGLIHSFAAEDNETAKANRDKAVQSLEEEGVKLFVDGLVPKLFAEGEDNETLLERVRQIGYTTSLHGAQATARGMKARADRSSLLQQVKLPVLLVAGSQDRIATPELMFQAAGQSAHKVELSDASHMSMLEQPEKLAREIIDFCAGIERE